MNGQRMDLLTAPRAELRNLGRAWKRRQRASSVNSAAHAAVLLTFAAIAAIAGVGLFDGQAALAARTLPLGMIAVSEKVTRLGASGYIFVLATLFVLAGIYLAPRAAVARQSAAMRLVASRALLVFAVAVTSGLASQVVKHVVGRARPRLMEQAGVYHFDMFSVSAKLASFPSGHTTTAFAIAFVLGLYLPKWRFPLFLAALAIGLSRIAIGSHYPSDVAAGALVGFVSAWLTARAFAIRRIAVEEKGGRIVARGPGLLMAALRQPAKSAKASPRN